MFLKPTANPVPRTMASPRPTFPATLPGRVRGSRLAPSGSTGGKGIAAQRSITSRTGADPLMTWPVGSTDPVEIAFLTRISIGSMPRALASLSICAS